MSCCFVSEDGSVRDGSGAREAFYHGIHQIGLQLRVVIYCIFQKSSTQVLVEYMMS